MDNNQLASENEVRVAIREILDVVESEDNSASSANSEQLGLIAALARTPYIQRRAIDTITKSLVKDPLVVVTSALAIAIAAGIKIGRKQQLSEFIEHSFQDKENKEPSK